MNNDKNQTKIICESCGFEYKISQMMKRKDGKLFCYMCAYGNRIQEK